MNGKQRPQPLRGESLFVRQSGGMHRYGHVILSIEPAATPGMSLAWEVTPAQIPDLFKAAVVQGVRRAALPLEQCLGGVLVRISGGSFHETDSNEQSFEMSAFQAMQDALKRGAF